MATKNSLYFKMDEIKRGTRVIIRNNKHNYANAGIIGEVVADPDFWTNILVRYFDPFCGEDDENGQYKGEFVTRKFVLTALEKPSPSYCLKMAQTYKRLALEFNELSKTLTR